MERQFRQYQKPPPDHRIIKLRDIDDKARALTAHLKANKNVVDLAVWEHKTDGVIKKNNLMKRYETLLQEAHQKLEQRRAKLAEKMEAERLQMQDELIKSQGSGEERRAAMVERAIALEKEREEERQKVADEMLYRAWAEGCDPLRANLMKKVVMNTIEERNTQLWAKVQRMEIEKDEKQKIHEMYENERLKKEQRHLDDKRRRKELDADAVRIIGRQQVENEDRRKREVAEEAVQIEELHKVWAADNAKAEAEIAARLEQARLDGEELLRNNILLGERRAVEAEKEKAEDEALLKVALLKAAEEDDRELESKVKAKREAQEFREQLLVLMEKEAADNSVRDELIKQADAKFAAKREADEARVIAQRQALLDEVMDTRAAQVKDRLKYREIAAADLHHERALLKSEMARVQKVEEEYTHREHMKRVQNQMDIVAQIRQKENVRSKEKLEKERAIAGAKEAENVYMSMVNAHQQEPVRWFGRRAVQWYD